MSETANINRLKLKRLGIDTLYEHVIFIKSDGHICKSEGFEALTRVKVSNGNLNIVATLDVISSDLIGTDEASLSESGCEALQASDGDEIEITHLSPIDSIGLVRAKIYGKELSDDNYYVIMNDIVQGNYSTVHLTGFVTAVACRKMGVSEIVGLTRAMINTGEKLSWPYPVIMDKHCIGGIPANRTDRKSS